MKEIKDMSYEELKEEIKYIVTNVMDDQPYYHDAYLADLAAALAEKAVQFI